MAAKASTVKVTILGRGAGLLGCKVLLARLRGALLPPPTRVAAMLQMSAHSDARGEVMCPCRCHDDADLHEGAVLEEAVDDLEGTEELRSRVRVDLPQEGVESAVEGLPRRSNNPRRAVEGHDGRTYHLTGVAFKTADIASLRVKVISEADGLVRMDLWHDVPQTEDADPTSTGAS